LKPKLLIIELWGIGDLVIATPFVRKASEHFDVTLLAKPFALEMQPRFWPGVQVIPFTAPWTAFKKKYDLLKWPWKKVMRVWRHLYNEQFDVGLSARWDPRDHFLLKLSGARARLGFPRTGSSMFLTHPMTLSSPLSHRYENWRLMGTELKLNPEPLSSLSFPRKFPSSTIMIHTGAAQSIRVWPLENYRKIAVKLRALGHDVRILCNPDQVDWWKNFGEPNPSCPASITELLDLLDHSAVFIGNDSGPGHVAAFCGLPTFTVFGPQLAEWFIPMHPASESFEGKPCPYKPCSDYCRYDTPHCLTGLTEEEVWPRIRRFVEKNVTHQKPLAMAGARESRLV